MPVHTVKEEQNDPKGKVCIKNLLFIRMELKQAQKHNGDWNTEEN